MINIVVDVQNLLDQVYLDKSQVDDMLDYTVKEITARFADQWQTEAETSLKSSRQEYIANLNVIDEGKAKGAVVLTGWLPNAIESGMDEVDLKVGLLNGPNAKTDRKNEKYNTVPFSHGTPGSLEENFSSGIMPKEVHKVAKSKDIGEYIKKKELPKKFQEPQKKKLGNKNSLTLFKQYQHKHSIYEGITKTKDIAGNTSYSSFRRVSESSDVDSWLHPGLEARNLAEKALDSFDLPSQTGMAFDQWWAQNM